MKRSKLLLAFLLGLIAGLGGETLLFLQSQTARVAYSLRDDFRVLLFLKGDLDDGRQKVLEEKLRALPDVEDARYVSRREALAALRREDPELVDSIALLGDSPLNPAYEVRLAGSAIGRLPQWLAEAGAVWDWADARYKGAQARAMLQAEFYGHVIDLALSAIVCLTALLALTALWSGRGQGLPPLEALLAGAGGAAAGAALTALMVLPMRVLTPWWSWPSGARQAALLAASGIAGWVLCRRGD